MGTGNKPKQKMVRPLTSTLTGESTLTMVRGERVHLEVDGKSWCQVRRVLEGRVLKSGVLPHGVRCQYYSKVNALSVAMMVQQELPDHVVEVKEGRCPSL